MTSRSIAATDFEEVFPNKATLLIETSLCEWNKEWQIHFQDKALIFQILVADDSLAYLLLEFHWAVESSLTECWNPGSGSQLITG